MEAAKLLLEEKVKYKTPKSHPVILLCINGELRAIPRQRMYARKRQAVVDVFEIEDDFVIPEAEMKIRTLANKFLAARWNLSRRKQSKVTWGEN